MAFEIASGYLYKITGQWEKPELHYEPQTTHEDVKHLVFWQLTDQIYGSWILFTSDNEEELHASLNWGTSLVFDDNDEEIFDSIGYGQPLPLLDCDDSGCCQVWLLDYNRETTYATVLIKT